MRDATLYLNSFGSCLFDFHTIKGGNTVGLQNTIKALSDPIRREILEMLKGGRMAAGEIAEKFPVSGAAISKHLSVLRESDLIRDTREGKFIYYELNTSVLEEVMLWISGLKGDKNE
jgi:DNA-binding transcriptional ArsR family regulator